LVIGIGIDTRVIDFRESYPGAGAAGVGDLGGITSGCEGRKQGRVFTAEDEGEGTETGDVGGIA